MHSDVNNCIKYVKLVIYNVMKCTYYYSNYETFTRKLS